MASYHETAAKAVVRVTFEDSSLADISGNDISEDNSPNVVATDSLPGKTIGETGVELDGSGAQYTHGQTSEDYSVSLWWKQRSVPGPTVSAGLFGNSSPAGLMIMRAETDDDFAVSQRRDGVSEFRTVYRVGNMPNNEWVHYGFSHSDGDGRYFRNGAFQATDGSASGSTTLATPADGLSELARFRLLTESNLYIGESMLFAEVLADSEFLEIYNGPEPYNPTPAVIVQNSDQIETTSPASWTDPNNGTISVTYQWQSFNGSWSNIDGATDETLSAGLVIGTQYRRIDSASNDGGNSPIHDATSNVVTFSSLAPPNPLESSSIIYITNNSGADLTSTTMNGLFSRSTYNIGSKLERNTQRLTDSFFRKVKK